MPLQHHRRTIFREKDVGLPASHEDLPPRGQIQDLPPYQLFSSPNVIFLDAQCSNSCVNCLPVSQRRPQRPTTEQDRWNSRSHTVWAIGGTSQAHSLQILLLRAGIESNPGPGRCDWCLGTIRERVSHLKCAIKGCDSVCHKHKPCSQIERSALGTTKWMCSSHNPNQIPQIHPSPAIAQASPAAKCPTCKSNLRKNPIFCTVCNKGSHQDCSGLEHRYLIKRARPTWKCGDCDPNSNNPGSASNAVDEPDPSSHSELPRVLSAKRQSPHRILSAKSAARPVTYMSLAQVYPLEVLKRMHKGTRTSPAICA